jgi:hypothetical protein
MSEPWVDSWTVWVYRISEFVTFSVLDDPAILAMVFC